LINVESNEAVKLPSIKKEFIFQLPKFAVLRQLIHYLMCFVPLSIFIMPFQVWIQYL